MAGHFALNPVFPRLSTNHDALFFPRPLKKYVVGPFHRDPRGGQFNGPLAAVEFFRVVGNNTEKSHLRSEFLWTSTGCKEYRLLRPPTVSFRIDVYAGQGL